MNEKHCFSAFPLIISFIAKLVKSERYNREFWKMKRVVGNSPFRLNSMIIFNLWTRAIKYGKKDKQPPHRKEKRWMAHLVHFYYLLLENVQCSECRMNTFFTIPSVSYNPNALWMRDKKWKTRSTNELWP